MTDEQVRKAFVAIVGVEPRQADLQVVALLGGDVEALTEYIWDHWLGEPDSPTLDEVEAAVKLAIGEE